MISEYGHTCFKVSFKINSSLTTGTCMYICKWIDIQKLKLYMRLYTHTSLYCKSFQKSFSTCHVCTICFVYILKIHVQFCAKVGAFVFCIHVQILNTWSMHVQVPVAFDKVLIIEEAVIIYLLVFKNWNIVMLSDLLYISLRVELSTMQNFYL